MAGSLMMAMLLLGESAAAQQQDSSRVTILGRLLDDASRAPVPLANVQLLRADSTLVASVVSDTAGRFRFSTLERGPYRFRSDRIGYERTISPPLEIVPGSTVEIDFLIAVDAVPLRQIVVRTTRLPPRAYYASVGMESFHRRMLQWQRRNSGTFLTRDSIAQLEHTTTSLLLSRFPGVLYDGPGRLRMRGDCTPRYFVDEVPWTPAPGTSIDEMFPPAHLEAVEIYTGSAVPGEFFGRACGVIVFWTRRS